MLCVFHHFENKKVMMMEAPCQRIVWDVLPAIRAAIAVELVKCGMSQVEAARMLEIAPSAVSQYLSGKRGYRIEFENEVKRSIEHLAEDLRERKNVNLVQRTCDICRQLRDGDEQCSVSSGTEAERCGS
jgi:predicted transcriptional regulator